MNDLWKKLINWFVISRLYLKLEQYYLLISNAKSYSIPLQSATLESWKNWFRYLHLKCFVAIPSQNTVFFLSGQGIFTLGKEGKYLLSDNLISWYYLKEWDNVPNSHC